MQRSKTNQKLWITACSMTFTAFKKNLIFFCNFEGVICEIKIEFAFATFYTQATFLRFNNVTCGVLTLAQVDVITAIQPTLAPSRWIKLGSVQRRRRLRVKINDVVQRYVDNQFLHSVPESCYVFAPNLLLYDPPCSCFVTKINTKVFMLTSFLKGAKWKSLFCL